MQPSSKCALALAPLLFGLLSVPRAARADVYANCPAEPASNVSIALGETFAGTNCNLYTDGDIDSYVFTGTTGVTYRLAAAINGNPASNICLTLYSPSAAKIFSGCTGVGFGGPSSVVTSQKLAVTGLYTMVITEVSSAQVNYGVSLERLYPFPSDAQPVPKLGQSLAADITPLTDSDAFTFLTATTGTYQVTATMSSSNSNLCMTVYFSNFASAGSGCTGVGFGGPNTVQIAFTPTTAEAGTNMAFVYVNGDNSTATYSLEVSCLVGNCPPLQPPPPPACTLSDSATYNATTSTLTMKFTVGNNLGTAAIWNAWLTYADPQGTDPDTMQLLFSTSQPITNPPVTTTKTFAGLPAEGKVGILSTLSTAKNGIACSSWVQVNTGTDPLSPSMELPGTSKETAWASA